MSSSEATGRRPPARLHACAALLLASCAAGCAAEGAGGRLWVHDVRFHGNQHASKSTLLEHITLDETSWIPLSPKKYFDPLTFEVDQKRVVAWYRAHGFFLARVTGTRVHDNGNGSVDVDVEVDEGPRTRVVRFDVSGLEALPLDVRGKVTRKLPLREAEPFDHDGYLASRDLVQARLRAAGYAWAKTSGEARVDRDRQTADIELRVEPGPLVRFGRVRVTGGTDPDAVARRSAVREGERFDPELLEATRGRLQSVGRFARIQVKEVPRPGDPTIADVEIDVTPGPRNEIKIGAGLGLDQDRQDVHLPMRYVRYGFLGGLRTLTLRARPGYMVLPAAWNPQLSGPLLQTDLTFQQPDFLARDLLLRAQVGYDLGVDYAFKYHGPRSMLGVEYALWRDRVTLGLSYNFQYLFFWNLSNPDVFNDPDQARTFLGYTDPYRLAYVLESVTLDLRDQSLDPHSGVYLRVEGEEGHSAIGGMFDYEKVTPDLRGYLPLFKRRIVVSGRVLYGRLFAQGGEASPITRRFYLGGADSHRGFGYNRLSPQIDSATTSLAIPVGGNEQFLASVELRGNVLRIKKSWLGLAMFVDAGDVPQPGYALDFRQLHLAVGPGLRYATVIGVLRADVGIRLNRLSPTQADGRQNPDPGQRFQFHISIGEAF